VVDFVVGLPGVVDAAGVGGVVVDQAGAVHRGVEVDEALAGFVEAGGGDEVGGEELAGVAGEGERIVDPVRDLGEVAVLHGGGGDGGDEGLGLAAAVELNGAEEEGLVAAGVVLFGDGDGAAEGAAELVEDEVGGGGGGGEEVFGVEFGVAEEFEGGAVEIAAAGLDDDVGEAAGGAAVLGVGGAGLDLELLDGVDGREDGGAEAVVVFGVVEALDEEGVPVVGGADAVDGDVGDAAAGGAGEAGGVAIKGRHGAGGERDEGGEVARVQRQLGDGARGADVAERRGFALELDRGGLDGDLLAGAADFELEVGGEALVHFDADVEDGGFEAGDRDAELVVTGLERGGLEAAGLVGLELDDEAGGRAFDGDVGRGDDGSGRIRDAAGDGAGFDLGPGQGGEEDE